MADNMKTPGDMDHISLMGALITHAQELQARADQSQQNIDLLIDQTSQQHKDVLILEAKQRLEASQKSEKLLRWNLLGYTTALLAVFTVLSVAVLFVMTAWQRNIYAELREKTAQLETKNANLQSSIVQMEGTLKTLTDQGGNLKLYSCNFGSEEKPDKRTCILFDDKWRSLRGPKPDTYYAVPVFE